jgi:hypothetical protein
MTALVHCVEDQSNKHRAMVKSAVFFFFLASMAASNGFIQPANRLAFTSIRRLYQAGQQDEEERVAVGSKEYYEGFVKRGLNEEPTERVTGDALLTPILKFAASSAALIGAFFFLFLKANDII